MRFPGALEAHGRPAAIHLGRDSLASLTRARRGKGGAGVFVWPLLSLFFAFGCAQPSLYITPAREEMAKSEVAFLDLGSSPVLDGHRMELRKVDDVPVRQYFHAYLFPGWHFFEYGYDEHTKCRRYRYTKAYVDYGIGTSPLRTPRRDRIECLEWAVREHRYSGWFRTERGRRYLWTGIQPLLKKHPDPGGIAYYEKKVPGVPYRNP